MGMPMGWQWIVILVVILILFGGKKIPELAKGLGSGIKNFKKAVKEDEDEEVVEESIEVAQEKPKVTKKTTTKATASKTTAKKTTTKKS